MAAIKPKKAKMKRTDGIKLEDNSTLTLGTQIQLDVDGVAGNGAPANREHGVFIRVFYRINGMPFAQTIFNGPATEQAGNTNFNIEAAPGTTGVQFTPTIPGPNSFRIIAWDKRNGHTPRGLKNIRTNSVRVNVKK